MTFTRRPSIRKFLFQHTCGASRYLDAVIFAMLKTITATICLHPIRSSAELPHSANGIDFEVPYCGSCTKHRQISAEHDAAEREHGLLEALQQPGDDRSKLRAARIRYNRAHLAYLQDMEQRAERYQKDHGVAPQGAATETHELAHKSVTGGRPKKKVRLDAMAHHRPEGEYRLQQQFDRTSSLYEPGLYADRSGTGYTNTCDPYESDLSDLSDEETESLLRDGKVACSSAMEVCEVESENAQNPAGALSPKDDDPADEGYFDQLSCEEITERRDVIQERIDQLLKARSERRANVIG